MATRSLTICIIIGAIVSCQCIYFNRKPPPVQNIGRDVGEPLILTPLIEAGNISEALEKASVTYKDFVKNNLKSYSGYFTVDKNFDSNLFFWFFLSQDDPVNDPIILWLQGGPGASSIYGLFRENGPYIVDENLNLTYREHSWTKNHSVLYIDNPAGTGFSFTSGGFAENQTKVGKDFYNALTQFFTLFSDFQKNDFFISGESYGGKYIPTISYVIYQKNQEDDVKVKINLKGFAIGNPLSDPINQADYGSYAYYLGLIDTNTKQNLSLLHANFTQAIKKQEYFEATNLLTTIRDTIHNASELPSIYNHQTIKPTDPDYWANFLIQDHIRPEIHVGNVSYGATDQIVYNTLWADKSRSVAPTIEVLLDNYRTLFFNGQLDTLDPYPLMINFLKKLNFSGSEEYKTANRNIWYVDKEIAGYFKSAGNFTEVLVRDAGHMVPTFQPKWAYNLIYKFTRGLSLN